MGNVPYIPQNYNTRPENDTPAPFAPQVPAGTPRLIANEPPSPRGDVSAIPANPQTMGPIPGVSSQSGPMAEMYGWAAPNVPNDGALQKTGPNSWTAGSSGPSNSTGFTQPGQDYLQQAIDTYESMDPAQEGGTVGYTGEGHYLDEYNRNADSMGGDTRRAPSAPYSVGGTAPGQQRPRDPYQALQAPDMPKFKGEEYNAPERDQAIYDEERRKAMGPGMRALREGTREAISSSQSLDNPNARGKFIQQALHGYGQGLESVASQADRQATMTADKRHAEAVSMYRTKYDYKRDEDLMNFKGEISTIATNFAAESAASIANYNAGFDQNTGGQTTMERDRASARSKSTYYGNNPNIGYFAG